MADSPRLTSLRLAVTLEDGARLEVQTRNPDLIRWERTQAKHHWPKAVDAPQTWMTFIAWAALRRESQIPAEVSWEDFSDTRCVGVENLTDDDDPEDDLGRPTPPGPDPG